MIGTASSRDGITVSYEAVGSGTPALVFVHGWSCDRRYWRHQLKHFAPRFQVVAVELAGHGESGAGRKSFTIPAFGSDVAAVVEQLGLEKIVLVGHSMGGDVAVDAALQLPGRVVALVWVDVYNSLGTPRTHDELEEFIAPLRRDFVTETRNLMRKAFLPTSDAELVDWVINDMSAAPPDIAMDALKHSFTNDGPILAKLKQLTAPVVQINFGHRPYVDDSLEQHGVKTLVIPGLGHFGMMEDPEAFNRVLGEVIADLGGVRPGEARPASN